MASDANSNRSRLAGFTLVELLVVIGIIALLISILIPTLNKARTASQVTKCLSNIRQLAMATNGYISQNRGTLPEAMYNNKTGLLTPRGVGAESWTPYTAGTFPLFTGRAYVMPSIGAALSPFLGKGDAVWQCPNGSSDYNAVDPYASEGPDPYIGTAAPNVWMPNYFYLNTKVYAALGGSVQTVAAGRAQPGFNGTATDWTIRNVAGLRATKARSVTGQAASEIVVFCEYKSTFHTRSKKDVYGVVAPDKTEYHGNYAFLDGHAETRKYANRESYMAQFHQPIRQSWFGRDFATHYADFYESENLLQR